MDMKGSKGDVEMEHVEMLSNGDIKDEEASRSREERGTWKSEVDFVLACIGFAVGIGNIWRFPYLCYKNGGGAFLIPYFFCLITCGVPLLVLEVGLGQYMGVGSIGVWKICPGFAGIGVASFVITSLMNIYYIIVLTWAIFYLYSSFTSVLPWSTCDNEWNTARCFADDMTFQNTSQVLDNGTVSMTGQKNQTVDAVVEFWERRVLDISSCVDEPCSVVPGLAISLLIAWVYFCVWRGLRRRVLDISSGVNEPGSVVPGLAISLLIAWVLVYFCVWRGVRWTGKVVYFTALFPYVVLTCLLIRGVTLNGAVDGLWFYIKPDLSRLSDPQVWIDGGTQIFFSYAVALGALVSLGSYNKFHNNFFKDCMIIAAVNSGTSLYGGVAVFSVLGFMAKQQNVSIADVAESGPGLVFIAYPKAVTQMPVPQLWAILFFIMILFIGLDSQFVDVEAFLTPVFDMFPRALVGMKRRMLVAGIYCAVSYLLGISMITQGGMYIFQLFDYYSASGLVLLWVSFFETFIISWVFGSDKFQDAIELMIGYRIPYWFFICWKFITPLVSLGIFLFILVVFEPLTYNKTYTYPILAQGLGLCLAIASIVCIPIVFCIRFISASGSLKQRWKRITKPRLKEYQLVKPFTITGTGQF